MWDRVIMVDWSGGNDTGPTPRKDAIWAARAEDGTVDPPHYMRNRMLAEAWLADEIEAALAAGNRLMIGFDFPFGYPAGFARKVTGSDDPFALWAWLETRIQDSANENNRFDLAAEMNRLFPGVGPFWGNGLKRDIADLPRKGLAREGHGMAERRRVETLARGAFPVWQLSGAGAVGGQVLMGLPVLERLRRRFPEVRVWPFEPLDGQVSFVEIWPSLTLGAAPEDMIKDAWQVERVAGDLAALPQAELSRRLDVTAPEEGWILGVDQG